MTFFSTPRFLREKTRILERHSFAGVFTLLLFAAGLFGITMPAFAVSVKSNAVTVYVRPQVSCAPVVPVSSPMPGRPVNEVSINQAISWKAAVLPAEPSGGSFYTYRWSGTDGLSGASAQVSKSYGSLGIKTATVTVAPLGISAPENLTVTASCGTVSVTGAPDLTANVPALSGETEKAPGAFTEGLVTLSSTVSNVGVIAAPGTFKNKYYFGTSALGTFYSFANAGNTADLEFSLTDSVSPLSPNKATDPNRGMRRAVSPHTWRIGIGTWYFKVCADRPGSVTELDEGNNCSPPLGPVVVSSGGGGGGDPTGNPRTPPPSEAPTGICFAAPSVARPGAKVTWTVDPDENIGTPPYIVEWTEDKELEAACRSDNVCRAETVGAPYSIEAEYQTTGTKRGGVRIFDREGQLSDISCQSTVAVGESAGAEPGFTLHAEPGEINLIIPNPGSGVEAVSQNARLYIVKRGEYTGTAKISDVVMKDQEKKQDHARAENIEKLTSELSLGFQDGIMSRPMKMRFAGAKVSRDLEFKGPYGQDQGIDFSLSTNEPIPHGTYRILFTAKGSPQSTAEVTLNVSWGNPGGELPRTPAEPPLPVFEEF